MDDFDRVALITGGGRGLGRVIARRLSGDGFVVVIAGPAQGELEEVCREIEDSGRSCLAVVADVSREEDVRMLVEQARSRCGRIDVLVNNAGVMGPTARAEQIDRADWDRVLAVNLTGAFLCAKAVLPEMTARRSGKIVNISSLAGKMAYALRSPYAVSKWGLNGLTLTLAKEAGEFNVQVNAVCPGPVEGERMRGVIERRAAETGRSIEEIERDYVEATALKRMVKPDDVAAAVAFLVSPEADHVTGQLLDVSAGYGL